MVERLRLCAAKVLDAVQRRCQVADIKVPRLLNHAVPLAVRTLVGHDPPTVDRQTTVQKRRSPVEVIGAMTRLAPHDLDVRVAERCVHERGGQDIPAVLAQRVRWTLTQDAMHVPRQLNQPTLICSQKKSRHCCQNDAPKTPLNPIPRNIR